MVGLHHALPTFELRSAALTLVAVVLRTTDLALLSHELQQRFGGAPELFDKEPVAIDLGMVREALEPIDFAVLIELLRAHKMVPIAVKSGNPQQMQDAVAAGLSEAHGSAPVPGSTPEASRHGVAAEPGPSAAALPEPLHSALPPSALVLDKPLRSGQRVYAKGRDLIVLAVVSYAAEVIADGNIHVYAPLRGRALAGANGDVTARIFSTCMEPQLLSIAGIYRTTEAPLPSPVLGKPAQVRLDGERLVVEALNC